MVGEKNMGKFLLARLHGEQPLLMVCCFLLIVLVVLAGCGAAGPVGVHPGATATTGGHGTSSTLAPQPTPFVSPTATSIAAARSGQTSFPPGATLLSETQCSASVKHSSFEPRPQNTQANQTTPTAQQIAALAPWDAKDRKSVV